jgi:GNAT superfamily N-acetyltransferase
MSAKVEADIKPGYSSPVPQDSSPIRSVGPDWLKLLSPKDAPAVFDLFTRCADFFILQDGEPPAPADAEELFTDLPRSKQPEDQHIFGFCRKGKLDALAALLVDYPVPGDWYLGLLLVEPASRRSGLGKEMYASIKRWAADRSAMRMRIGVLQENASAYPFWRSLGFERLRTVGPRAFKGKMHLLDEFATDLGEALPAERL